jgi:phage terminase large subunit GpA-like protein
MVCAEGGTSIHHSQVLLRSKSVTGPYEPWAGNPILTQRDLDGNEPPGYCHFPEYGRVYFEQLTAEQMVVRTVRGYQQYQWEETRDRNEALDCRIYARAAAAIMGLDRLDEKHWSALSQRKLTDRSESSRIQSRTTATDAGGRTRRSSTWV